MKYHLHKIFSQMSTFTVHKIFFKILAWYCTRLYISTSYLHTTLNSVVQYKQKVICL